MNSFLFITFHIISEVPTSDVLNIAREGTAWQSSVFGDKEASFANDGIAEVVHEMCAHTQLDAQNYWALDLHTRVNVAYFMVTNRNTVPGMTWFRYFCESHIQHDTDHMHPIIQKDNTWIRFVIFM